MIPCMNAMHYMIGIDDNAGPTKNMPSTGQVQLLRLFRQHRAVLTVAHRVHRDTSTIIVLCGCVELDHSRGTPPLARGVCMCFGFCQQNLPLRSHFQATQKLSCPLSPRSITHQSSRSGPNVCCAPLGSPLGGDCSAGREGRGSMV